jgi:hypothetical protein
LDGGSLEPGLFGGGPKLGLGRPIDEACRLTVLAGARVEPVALLRGRAFVAEL